MKKYVLSSSRDINNKVTYEGEWGFFSFKQNFVEFQTQIIVKGMHFVLSIVTLNYHVENFNSLPISFIVIVTHLPYFLFPWLPYIFVQTYLIILNYPN
jgi:hypothetical protein